MRNDEGIMIGQSTDVALINVLEVLELGPQKAVSTYKFSDMMQIFYRLSELHRLRGATVQLRDEVYGCQWTACDRFSTTLLY